MTVGQEAYAYRAARRDGTMELGTIDAPNRDVASATLAGRGLWVLEVREETRTPFRRALSAADLALGLRLLASLLEASLPLNRALAAFEDVAPDRWQPALPSIHRAVREGQSLGAALATAPLDMPPVVLGMIRAGEAGSGLSAAVRRAAEFMEATAATRSAIRAALTYPLVLALAGGGSLALLVGVVLPRFAAILKDLGLALPATTRAVLWAAAVARAATIPGTLALAATLVAWRVWVARPSGRRQWHESLLALPIIGTIRQSAAVARAANAIGSLLASGVPVAPAVLAGAHAAGDAAIEARLLIARDAILAGARIGRALTDARAATPTVIRLVSAGEESGQLAPLIARAASMEAERAERLVKDLVRIAEPALILVFGALVAFVATALLQAIYTVRPVG